MAIQKTLNADNIETTQDDWWFLYNSETRIVISGPMQCSGYTTSPHIMIIGDTKDELLAYIDENNLTISVYESEL